MKRCAFLSLVLIAAVGCGGGGENARPATDATRTVVAQTLVDAQSTLGHSSFQLRFLPIFDVRAGSEPTVAPLVGDSIGGAPEDPTPTFYFGDWLGAWIQVAQDESSYREDYYLDEAKSRPAGFYEGDEAGERYELTAGPYAGAHGEGEFTVRDLRGEDRDAFAERYRKVAPDGTVFEGEYAWVGDELTFKGTTTYADGSKDAFEGRDVYPGNGRLAFRSRRGTTLTATFSEATDEAKGTIRGSADGLNATFAIDKNGAMALRFADGSKLAFEGGDGLPRKAFPAQKLGLRTPR